MLTKKNKQTAKMLEYQELLFTVAQVNTKTVADFRHSMTSLYRHILPDPLTQGDAGVLAAPAMVPASRVPCQQ